MKNQYLNVKRWGICLLAITCFTITLKAQTSTELVGGIKFEVTKCQHYGKGLVVWFTMTNTTSREIGFSINYDVDENQTTVMDDNGQRYYFRNIVAGRQSASSNYSWVMLPPDIKIKCAAYTYEVPEKLSSLRQFNIDGRFKDAGTKQILFKNIPIEELSNTNQPNMKLTYPMFTAKAKSLVRVGNKVEQQFTIINNDDEAWDLEFNDITVYDADGNSYEAVFLLGPKSKLEPSIPRNYTLIVKNVPQNVNEFSLIRAEFDRRWFKVEWKNQKVENQIGPNYKTTKDNFATKITKVECLPNATKVYFEFTNLWSQGKINISPKTYITGSNGQKLQIVKAINIPYPPQIKTIESLLETLEFCLIFPALPSDTKQFDLIESEDSKWKFYEIQKTD